MYRTRQVGLFEKKNTIIRDFRFSLKVLKFNTIRIINYLKLRDLIERVMNDKI